ncbi:MAG: signal peptide peptidase SppA [Candidatus Syntrophosphaera sp.]|nr:signal peptide peptidase SppA [Candidatus Syntrophosphaera sp.]
MKATILIVMLILMLPALAFAQDWRDVNLGSLAFPSASIDNLFVPIANPSLLGTGTGSGLGWAHMFDENEFQKHYWFFANLDYLSYVYEYTQDGDKSVNFHTLATGMEFLPRHILPNLYTGANYRWKNNEFGKGAWRTAVTYRPHASSSIAFNWDNPYKEAPQYHAGLAFRPLAFVKSARDYRLELSADMDYSKEEGEYGFRNPVLGINTRVFDGLNLGATYNLDTETAFLTFSISAGKTDLGALASVRENDNFAIPYVHFTDDVFSPFLGLKGRNWYNMKLKGDIVTYKAPKYELGPVKVFSGDAKSIEEVIADLEKAKNDPQISGILLKDPSFSTSYGLRQELADAIRDFKAGGKQFAVYYNNISNTGYMFAASVADQIYLNPMGSVDLRGLMISSPYLHDLLDHLGVDVMNFRSHKYKSAGNMFSEAEMTEAEREVYESLLNSIYGQYVAAMETGRGEKLKQSVRETIDNGPYFLAQDALDAGLVDALIFEDELDKQLKEDFGFSKQRSELPDYKDFSWAKPKESLIAVIYASGNIVMGKGTPGTKIAQETTVKLIRAARNNKNYKGIILRVDSGGGSAQASDIILRELQLAQTDNKKPVIVSMAGVAASGGYYIACGADRIIADPATLTGSIGVIGISFSLPRLYEKIKVNLSTVKVGENADFGSTSRLWTEEEESRMTRFIETVYDDFVGKVDSGRANLSLEEVNELAQGRVWTGEQALANGLIDDLGGLDKAVEHMRDLTGIKGKITLVDATTQQKGFAVQMSGNPFGGLLKSGAVDTILGDYVKLYELYKDFQNESVLMLCPLGAASIQY